MLETFHFMHTKSSVNDILLQTKNIFCYCDVVLTIESMFEGHGQTDTEIMNEETA